MMSATTNNSSSSSSPRRMSENHGQSPRRPSRQVSSPWSQIVRGESDPIVAAPSSPQSKASAAIEPIASVSVVAPPASTTVETVAEKNPVWNRMTNGGSEVEFGSVMGAASWPALSETAKAPSNKSSSDSLKSLGDVSSSSSSVPVSQGIVNASVPATKQAGRTNTNPTPSHSRQRPYRRNGASGSANGTVSQQSAQGLFPNNPSPRGQNQNNGFAAQTHGGSGGGGNDNLSQREPFRNHNSNNHHGGRRNQEQQQQHGNQNWNFHRNFNGRDGNAQSQRGTPAFVRHAPPPVQQPIPPPFMAAQHIRPFGSPVPFPPELTSPYYPPIPFMGPLSPAQLYYHVQDPPLNVKLQKQIHYYFSEENLITDTYLRGCMDDQGFAPLQVIAGFKRVRELTSSIEQIVEALQGSPFVEVQGERIRKRQNWQPWILPKLRSPVASSSIPKSDEIADPVTNRLGNMSLDQSTIDPSGAEPVSNNNHKESDGAKR